MFKFSHNLPNPRVDTEFVREVTTTPETDLNNDYTLFVDVEHEQASIIKKSKKGGKTSMIKTEVRACAGYEDLFNQLQDKKLNIEIEVDKAVQEAIEKSKIELENTVAEIKAGYAEQLAKADELLAIVSETVEIEVEDEDVEPDAEVVEEVEEAEVDVDAEVRPQVLKI